MPTDEVRVCYPWGMPGWLLVYTALGAGRSLWLGVWWYALRCVDIHFLVLACTGGLAMVLQYSAAAFLFRQPVEDALTACNNNVMAAPDLTAWLVFQYWTLAEVHDRWAGTAWAPLTTAWRALVSIGAPVILVLTRNTTWAWAAEGAAFGVAVGLVCASVILIALEPRMAAVVPHLAWAGVVKSHTGTCAL